MAAVVIGDVAHYSGCVNKKNLCGVSDAVESLFYLYMVCYINKTEKKKKEKKRYFWIEIDVV